MASQSSNAAWYSITNKGDANEPAEILIYDVIGGPSWWEDTVSAKQFVSDLKDIGAKQDVVVRINSPGGNVLHGTAIFNALRAHKGHVTTRVDGMALSMASVVAIAGDTVEMSNNALMMIHNPHGMWGGDAKAMRDYADLLDKMKSQLVAAYRTKSSKTEQEIAEAMDSETWLTAAEAKEFGFVDSVIESTLAVAASFDVGAISSVSGAQIPQKFAKRIESLMAFDPSAHASHTEPKGDDMSEAKPEVKAATVQELSALAGADSNFVVEQLNAGATLAQATNALNAKLTAEIAEARKQTAELIEKANNSQETDDEGVEPIGSASHSPSNGGTVGNHKPSGTANAVWGEDPVAFHNEKLDELIASGLSTAQASSQLNRKYPGLLNAMRNSVFQTA